MRLGSIEAGGTKFILAITDEHYRILKRQRVATTKPNETLEACVSFKKIQSMRWESGVSDQPILRWIHRHMVRF